MMSASAYAPPPTAGMHATLRARRQQRRQQRGSQPRRHRALVVRADAAATKNDIKVSFGDGETALVPGSGGVVGSGGSADAVVGGGGVDAEHAKLELRQGRIFVTAVSRERGTFLAGNRLFPGVAYAVAEGAVVVLGEGEESVELALEQTGEVAGDAGVDMMANLMKMQFEATMSPEVKAALKDDE